MTTYSRGWQGPTTDSDSVGAASSGYNWGGYAAAASAASSVISAYYGAKEQKANLRGAADIADINAKLSEFQAQTALEQGNVAESQSKLRTAQVKGSQRAAMAANGIDLGVGSAAQVLTTTDVVGEQEANAIHANAISNAWGYRAQETNFQNQALGQRATAASMSPALAAGTTALTGAGQVASQWYTYNKATTGRGF